MGDHRVSLKVRFEMHEHEANIDQWVNWTPDYADKIRDWLQGQIDIAMDKYWDREHDIRALTEAKQEDAEREELARLKAKYET